jgi:hypothetical protein
MPKVRPPSERAVVVARRVLAEAGVRDEHDLRIDLLAALHRAMAVHAPLSTARGAIVRAGQSAVICLDERRRGSPSEDFTTAHELMHHLLHPVSDHYVQCTMDGAERTEAQWDIEREASDGAAELLIPERMGAPYCSAPRATVAAIDHLARTFGRSFEMSAIRMVELTMAPCALVSSDGKRVRWALESLTFDGAIPRDRPLLHPDSLAARLARRAYSDEEREVPGRAWKGPTPFVERAWRLAPDRVLSWIVPA